MCAERCGVGLDAGGVSNAGCTLLVLLVNDAFFSFTAGVGGGGEGAAARTVVGGELFDGDGYDLERGDALLVARVWARDEGHVCSNSWRSTTISGGRRWRGALSRATLQVAL